MKNKEFLKSLAELAASLRQVIEAEVDGFDASPKAIAARRAKVFDPVCKTAKSVCTPVKAR